MKKLLIGTVATAALIALAPVTANAGGPGGPPQHDDGGTVEITDNNVADGGSFAMDDQNDLNSFNDSNSYNDTNSHNQDNDQDNDAAIALMGASAADHSSATMGSYNRTNYGNTAMVNNTKLMAVTSGTFVGHIVSSGDGGDGGSAVQTPLSMTVTKGGAQWSKAEGESDADAESGATSVAATVPVNVQDAEAGEGGLPFVTTSGYHPGGGGSGSDGDEAGNEAVAGGTADATANATANATSGDVATAADGSGGNATNDSCTGCDATATAGGGGGSGQAYAALATGNINSVSIGNTAGIMAVPMNTGMNATQLQSVSINAQASFN